MRIQPSRSSSFVFLFASLIGAQNIFAQGVIHPFGYYLPKPSEPNFSHVRWIEFTNYIPFGKTVPAYVTLRVSNNSAWQNFAHLRYQLKGRHFQFRTTNRNGRSYKFKGEFVLRKEKALAENLAAKLDGNNSITVLAGIFQTIQTGKILRAERLLFYFAIGE